MARTYVNSNIKLKTGGGVLNDATDGLNVDVGTTDGKIVAMTTGDKLPAVDGSELTNTVKEMVASNTLILSKDTEVILVDNTSYTVAQSSIAINVGGTYRIVFDLRGNSNGLGYGRIYRNGLALGTERSKSGPTNSEADYETFSEDLYFAAGDRIELYLRSAATATTRARNFRIYGDLTATLTGGVVIT